MNHGREKEVGGALGEWREEEILRKRAAALRIIGKRSIFHEHFILERPQMHGEEAYDGFSIKGYLSFEESWEKFEEDTGIKLEGDAAFLRNFLPERDGVKTDLQFLFYNMGIPLRAGWMNATLDETFEYEHLGVYQVIKGEVCSGEWSSRKANEGDWDLIESKKIFCEIFTKEVDELLELGVDLLKRSHGMGR